jgi:hypothetical protein
MHNNCAKRHKIACSVGRGDRGVSDPHNVVIEGDHVLVDHVTTDAMPIVRYYYYYYYRCCGGGKITQLASR